MPGAWNEVGCFLYGWEERGLCVESVRNGGGSEADRHRRLGKANGGGELTAKRSVAVKDSL